MVVVEGLACIARQHTCLTGARICPLPPAGRRRGPLRVCFSNICRMVALMAPECTGILRSPAPIASCCADLPPNVTWCAAVPQVHPLSDLQGMCSKKAGGALWNLLGSFNKCYHPDEHHLNMVEVTLTATLEDDVTCHDAEHSSGVLFDLIEAGVQSAASTKHVSTIHDFTCNVSG